MRAGMTEYEKYSSNQQYGELLYLCIVEFGEINLMSQCDTSIVLHFFSRM